MMVVQQHRQSTCIRLPS